MFSALTYETNKICNIQYMGVDGLHLGNCILAEQLLVFPPRMLWGSVYPLVCYYEPAARTNSQGKTCGLP